MHVSKWLPHEWVEGVLVFEVCREQDQFDEFAHELSITHQQQNQCFEDVVKNVEDLWLALEAYQLSDQLLFYLRRLLQDQVEFASWRHQHRQVVEENRLFGDEEEDKVQHNWWDLACQYPLKGTSFACIFKDVEEVQWIDEDGEVCKEKQIVIPVEHRAAEEESWHNLIDHLIANAYIISIVFKTITYYMIEVNKIWFYYHGRQ